MEAIVTALGEQHAELDGLLLSLSPDDWQRPSRCEGWTVADVVLHLAQTDELAAASVQGGYSDAVAGLASQVEPTASIDEGVDRMVARERDLPGPAIAERWRRGAAAIRELLSQADPQQRVWWIASEMSPRTLATTRLAEAWIHTGDVAAAFDAIPAPTDRLWHVARLAWRTLPYAFAQAGRTLTGPVALELRAPSGAAWDLVPEAEPVTVIRGDGAELCQVAARRMAPEDTGLTGDGPDADAVLQLIRTYA
jgi:uncharacterized protein (TIGR03084 family)